MPSVEIEKEQLYGLIGERIKEDKLAELLGSLGVELESSSNKEFVIEVFPNRPDFLSAYGIARGLRYLIGKDRKIKQYRVADDKGYRVIVDKSVKDVRPYTACCIAKGLKLDDAKIKELIRIQEKLHITFGRKRKKMAIGVYPLEHIKLPISFKADKPENIRFRPLESTREMNGKELLKKHPAGKEYGYLLEGKKRFPYFEDADGNVLSIPPIVNSHDTGKINENTKEVFIECSGFDIEYLKRGLNIISCALLDMGAKIYPMELRYDDFKIKTPSLEEEGMDIDEDYVFRIIGKKVDIAKALLHMGIRYEKGIAYIPPYRADILHPIDIVEDVAIGYGYDNVPSKMPSIYTKGEEDKKIAFLNKVGEVLVGAGFIEVKNFSLISNEDAKRFGLKAVKILNPSNKDYNVLRPSLIPCIMKVFYNNKSREFPQRIFEIGKVFPSEEARLCIGISSRDADFTRIKQVLQLLQEQLDRKFDVEELSKDYFIEGRAGKVMDGKEEIGEIGELHPSLIEHYELEMPVVLMEISLHFV
jgi:phenylalanyl-tRNA synthetase beta chain